MTAPQITTFIDPPLLTDSPDVFDAKAQDMGTKMGAIGTEINVVANFVEQRAQDAQDAQGYAQDAEDARDAAQAWATSTTAVEGGNKGAKGYAQDAQASASAASTAKGLAEAARDTASGHANAAGTARGLAEDARDAAELAAQNAADVAAGNVFDDDQVLPNKGWSSEKIDSVVGNLGTAAAKDAPASGNATAGQVVLGSDTRLSDARAPTAHTHTIANVTGLQAALDGKADTYTDTTASTNKTLADRERCTVTAAGKTVTLPASPAAGVTCVVLVGAFSDTVIARNGSTIMGLSENLTVDVENVAVTLVYTGSTWRIV